MNDIFPNYMAIQLSTADGNFRRWLEIRNHIDCSFSNIVVDKDSISKFNAFINSKIKYKLEQNWQYPQQTLDLGSGDCKDYASLKYSVLLQSGVPEENLAFIIAEIRQMPHNLPHAFCMVKLDDWWVLDNMFDHLIHPADYVNLTPLKMFSSTHGWLFSKEIHFG